MLKYNYVGHTQSCYTNPDGYGKSIYHHYGSLYGDIVTKYLKFLDIITGTMAICEATTGIVLCLKYNNQILEYSVK